MTQTRETYQVPGDPQLNYVLQRIADRLDRIEGLRPDLDAGLVTLGADKSWSTTADNSTDWDAASAASHTQNTDTGTTATTFDIGTSYTAPTGDNDAAPKKYVDDTIETEITAAVSGYIADGTLSGAVSPVVGLDDIVFEYDINGYLDVVVETEG